MCTVLQSASSAIRPGCVWQPSCGSLTPSSTGSDQLNCHMDEALSLLYGGKHTADVVLVVKEEAPLFCSDKENTKPAAKKQKTSAAQQTDCSKAVSATMLAHKALLWRMSEYFQYKVLNSLPAVIVLQQSALPIPPAPCLWHKSELYSTAAIFTSTIPSAQTCLPPASLVDHGPRSLHSYC